MSPAFVRSLRLCFYPCKCVYSSILQPRLWAIIPDFTGMHYISFMKLKKFKMSIQTHLLPSIQDKEPVHFSNWWWLAIISAFTHMISLLATTGLQSEQVAPLCGRGSSKLGHLVLSKLWSQRQAGRGIRSRSLAPDCSTGPQTGCTALVSKC